MSYEWNGLLGELVGQRLCCVEFVLDYVVLKFDNERGEEFPSMHYFVDPVVSDADGRYESTEIEWAHHMRLLTGKVVTSTMEAPNRGLTIGLQDATLALLPKESDLVGEEIAMMQGAKGWMVWRPGEEAFEYLM